MKEIGGYLGLELLPQNGERKFLHCDGILVNLGNSACELILRAMPKLKSVWISYYTCESVLEPIVRLGLSYQFYRLSENLEIDLSSLQVADNECVIYNNYFGIKDQYIKQLFAHCGSQLIIDNAQSFGTPHIPNSNAIYSPRKSFGVPDGGIAYISDELYPTDYSMLEQDYSFDRCAHLLKRLDISAFEGYGDFKKTGKLLHTLPLRRMSQLTQHILSSIDYDKARSTRKSNFEYLHQELAINNPLSSVCNEIEQDSFPAFYPFYSEDDQLRLRLINNKIYVATYWPNVLDWMSGEPSSVEYRMAKSIIPLPIDQRYTIEDMQRIVDIINNK